MGELKQKVEDKLKESMRSGDKLALNTMRALKSALRYREVDAARELEPDEELETVRREAKKRQEAAAEYRKGGRNDLADNEDTERAIIETLLPSMMSEADVEARAKAVIAETGAASPAETGKVMKALMAELKGKADGKLVNQVVARLLAP